MAEEITLQIDKDLLREGLAKYTGKAFKMIPKLDRPRILDIGCGPALLFRGKRCWPIDETEPCGL